MAQEPTEDSVGLLSQKLKIDNVWLLPQKLKINLVAKFPIVAAK